MRLVRIIVGWLSAPQQLFALAGLCAAAGLLWGYATVHENANRKLALRQGPPAAVAVQDYRGSASRGPAGEVVLHAEAELARPLVLTLPRTGERALAVPLFPVGGGDGAMGAILLPLGPDAADVSPEALAARIAGRAVEINGRVVDAGDFDLILAGALAVEGRHVGEKFVAVQPYVNGREAALQPIADPSRLWLWPLGLSFLLAVVASYRKFGAGLRFGLRPRALAARPRPAAAPQASAHFAPLRRQEDVNEPEPAPVGGALAALGMLLGVVVWTLRLLGRMTASLLRLLWAGVEEIRSPR